MTANRGGSQMKCPGVNVPGHPDPGHYQMHLVSHKGDSSVLEKISALLTEDIIRCTGILRKQAPLVIRPWSDHCHIQLKK